MVHSESATPRGKVPTVDLIIGYNKANTFPLLKKLLHRANELSALGSQQQVSASRVERLVPRSIRLTQRRQRLDGKWLRATLAFPVIGLLFRVFRTSKTAEDVSRAAEHAGTNFRFTPNC